jgi:hypothetical protein
MRIEVRPTGAFDRYFKRLGNAARQTATAEAIKLFATGTFDAKLRFERLVNRKGYFTIRADYETRVLLHKLDDRTYEAVAAGNHDLIYENYFRK